MPDHHHELGMMVENTIDGETLGEMVVMESCHMLLLGAIFKFSPRLEIEPFPPKWQFQKIELGLKFAPKQWARGMIARERQ